MEWIKPQYSKGKVNRAGDLLREWNLGDEDQSIEDFFHAFNILANWRSSHAYPLNTFQSYLRKILRNTIEGFVVQRLKRLPSIVAKLRRFEKMNLARMNDVGGLRAVLSSLDEVKRIYDSYVSNKSIRHRLTGEYDYIHKPKASGYRGIHLVYHYQGSTRHEWDGLLIELQIRTKLQHAWATAVEIVGAFSGKALKSSEGSQKWLDFFSLAGSAFAYLEGGMPVPGYENMSRYDTYRKVSRDARSLQVIQKLEGFRILDRKITTDKQEGHYHLIALDTKNNTVSIRSYGRRRLSEATEDYANEEEIAKDDDSIQVALVSSVSIESLTLAYPNYFADASEFIKRLNYIRRLYG